MSESDRASDGAWHRGQVTVWQGLRHEWLRRVPQMRWGFATPHRISRLANAITDQAAPHVLFAQAAGVDGNFMRPEARVGTLQALTPDGTALWSLQQRVRLETVDEVIGDPPQAHSLLRGEVVLRAPADGLLATALGGFSLTTRCDPALQPADAPCNSDGMWPFVLRFAVEGATARPVQRGEHVRVPVSLEVARGWTPHLGGLPPFEVKPLNKRLALRCDVFVTAVVAPADALQVEAGPTLRDERPLSSAPPATTTPRPAASTASARDDGSITVLRAAGFELYPPRRGVRRKHQHRGRYLRTLQLQAIDEPPGTRLVAHVGAPRTVVRASARTHIEAATWRLRGGKARSQTIAGRLCFNSTEQAPWFSAWRGCDDPTRGPACAEQRVPIR